jgi:hypothetical protein
MILKWILKKLGIRAWNRFIWLRDFWKNGVNLQEDFMTNRVIGVSPLCSTGNHNNNSIQFNSILVYLRANLTAQKPITKLARVRRNNNKTLTNKIQIRQFM